MQRLLWILVRFSLCAWIGAASLFVVTGVREVTSDLFEPQTKNQLAALRFPAFYLFGFCLVGIGTLASGILGLTSKGCRRRIATVLILSGAVFVTMVVDYIWIYTPLAELMSLPDARSRPEFVSGHNLSKHINIASLCVCFVAAVLAAGESRPSVESADKSA